MDRTAGQNGILETRKLCRGAFSAIFVLNATLSTVHATIKKSFADMENIGMISTVSHNGGIFQPQACLLQPQTSRLRLQGSAQQHRELSLIV